MKSRLEQEFGRYFFDTTSYKVSSGYGGFFFGGFGFRYGGDRTAVSEIVKNRVYLTNLPREIPFKTLTTNEENSALVVSCLDISELADSRANLLLEPGKKQIKYFVLAMADVSAEVGCVDQVYDALELMSQFADRKKPILIHCFSGVGRSAMITASHIAHRYLLSDPDITSWIDSFAESRRRKINRDSENFIRDLYSVVSGYVYSMRDCCQFDNETRNNFAISVLTEIHKKIQENTAIVGHRDENYCFLAELVQSSEYKQIQHHFYQDRDSQAHIKAFSQALLSNQQGWFQQLTEVTSVNQISIQKNNPFYQFFVNSKNPNDVRVLLEGFLATIDRLSLCFPEAKYSQKLASKETNDIKKTRSHDQFFENSTKAVEQDLKITFEEKTISDASYQSPY